MKYIIKFEDRIEMPSGSWQMVWTDSTISDEYDQSSEEDARKHWNAYKLDDLNKTGLHYQLICIMKDNRE